MERPAYKLFVKIILKCNFGYKFLNKFKRAIRNIVSSGKSVSLKVF